MEFTGSKQGTNEFTDDYRGIEEFTNSHSRYFQIPNSVWCTMFMVTEHGSAPAPLGPRNQNKIGWQNVKTRQKLDNPITI